MLALLLFPVAARSFAGMYRDFGGPTPVLTQLVLAGWIPIGVAVPSLAALALGAFNRTLGRRRAFVVGAFALGGVGLGVSLVGLYLPLFALANALSKP